MRVFFKKNLISNHANFSYLLQNVSQYLCHPSVHLIYLLALLYVKYKSILKVVVAVHICIQCDLKKKNYQQPKHFKNVVQKLKEAFTRLSNHVKIASLNYRYFCLIWQLTKLFLSSFFLQNLKSFSNSFTD